MGRVGHAPARRIVVQLGRAHLVRARVRVRVRARVRVRVRARVRVGVRCIVVQLGRAHRMRSAHEQLPVRGIFSSHRREDSREQPRQFTLEGAFAVQVDDAVLPVCMPGLVRVRGRVRVRVRVGVKGEW